MAKDNSGSENFHYNNIEKKDKNFMYKNFKRSNCYNCNFSHSNFNFATFRGAHFKTKNFSRELQGIRIFEGMPEINISSELEEALNSLMENKYVKASRIFDTKEGNINTLTLMILKENFNEEELIKGFKEIKSQIDRDFYTISYIIRLINKVIA